MHKYIPSQERKKDKLVRYAFSITGVLLVGLAVGLFRYARFGTDPFTCMNTGLSRLLGIDFAHWQLLVNLGLFAVVFFIKRSLLGFGTVVNMVCVGYISSFVNGFCYTVLGDATVAACLLLLAAACCITCLGVALYMQADLGVAPYDALAMIAATKTGKPFRLYRVCTDVLCVLLGAGTFLLSGGRVTDILGVGTLFTAFCTGPLIQYLRSAVALPLFRRCQGRNSGTAQIQ